MKFVHFRRTMAKLDNCCLRFFMHKRHKRSMKNAVYLVLRVFFFRLSISHSEVEMGWVRWKDDTFTYSEPQKL